MARSATITILRLFCTACLFCQVTTAQQATILLVERPAQLAVINRFQQTAAGAELRHLTPFAPMVIRNEHARLSDGVTPCMTVEIGGEPYQLILDEKGRLSGESRAGAILTQRDVRLLNDTVRIRTPLTLASPQHDVNRVLEHGAILLLRFSAGHEVYVEELRSGRFGWVPENAGSWEKLQLETPPATDQVSLDRPLIQETLDEANRLFVSLYDHFNRQSAQHLTPPRWELTLVPEGYSCTLTRAPESADYVETTDQMARALQVTLLGRGWTVRTIPLTILIYHPERDATAR